MSKMPIHKSRTLKKGDSKGTRRRKLSPAKKPPRKAKSKVRRKLDNLKSSPRGPYKLSDAKIREFTTWVATNPEMPLRLYCGRLGISVETLDQWRKLAEVDASSIYGRFVAAFERARNKAWENLQRLADRMRPHETLFRLHHRDYPNERLQLELSGVDGGPIRMAISPIEIQLCHSGAGSESNTTFAVRDERTAVPALELPEPDQAPGITEPVTVVHPEPAPERVNGIDGRLGHVLPRRG
jgi:hypothetical protein